MQCLTNHQNRCTIVGRRRPNMNKAIIVALLSVSSLGCASTMGMGGPETGSSATSTTSVVAAPRTGGLLGYMQRFHRPGYSFRSCPPPPNVNYTTTIVAQVPRQCGSGASVQITQTSTPGSYSRRR